MMAFQARKGEECRGDAPSAFGTCFVYGPFSGLDVVVIELPESSEKCNVE